MSCSTPMTSRSRSRPAATSVRSSGTSDASCYHASAPNRCSRCRRSRPSDSPPRIGGSWIVSIRPFSTATPPWVRRDQLTDTAGPTPNAVVVCVCRSTPRRRVASCGTSWPTGISRRSSRACTPPRARIARWRAPCWRMPSTAPYACCSPWCRLLRKRSGSNCPTRPRARSWRRRRGRGPGGPKVRCRPRRRPSSTPATRCRRSAASGRSTM